jgi:hypothetical protein
MPVVIQPTTTGSEPGLITLAALQAATADNALSADQQALLPGLVGTASGVVRRHCRRYFSRRPSADGTLGWYDGLYAPPWPGRDFLLREYPVNAIKRVRSDPQSAIYLKNTSTQVQAATAVLATVGVAATPDVPAGVTGLALWSVSAGVEARVALPFGSGPGQYLTVGALAAAVNALGSGWSATVPDGFADWATADFYPGQAPIPCLAPGGGPGLIVHRADIPAQYDARTGRVVLSRSGADPWASLRWGVMLDTDIDDDTLTGATGGLRVVYDAGYDTIPGPVQQATVEVAIDLLNLTSLDQRLGSETDGARGYVINTAFANYALPRSVQGKLSYWVNHRA